jgi:formylglycine-generating enzyme required for sulfatase activity
MCKQRKKLRILLVVAILIWPTVSPSKSDERASTGKRAAGSMLGKAPGEVRDDNGLKMKFVWCPPGFLTMEQTEPSDRPMPIEPRGRPATGHAAPADKESPAKVFITRGYWLGKYEVTQAEWKQVMGREPWKGEEYTEEGDDFPASSISWFDAMEFCRTLAELERKAGRLPEGWEYTLPTEAQWERACRARTETIFSFGDDASKLAEHAWFRDTAVKLREIYAHRVGQKQPNPWGLFDMHGNMWEWCRDVYTPMLPGGRDPYVTEGRWFRVVRGGGWYGDASVCRSASRIGKKPDMPFVACGFRVALSAIRSPEGPAAGTSDVKSEAN